MTWQRLIAANGILIAALAAMISCQRPPEPAPALDRIGAGYFTIVITRDWPTANTYCKDNNPQQDVHPVQYEACYIPARYELVVPQRKDLRRFAVLLAHELCHATSGDFDHSGPCRQPDPATWME